MSDTTYTNTQRTGGSSITFSNVTKTYPGQSAPALDALSLEIRAGELVSLVGPSGGGKTTALQLVNRLVDLSDGSIRIGDRSIMDIPAIELRRTIGYAIQQSGLFPHYTVAENIAVVPGILGWDRERIRRRTTELLELVGLTPVDTWLKRYPAQLSGGQQQRVGIARALASDPPVMLMDEPFGALDPITRAAVQDEFLEIQRRVGKTTLFVTHDIDEAIKMSDRIAVLQPGGKLAQYDTPDRILSAPASAFVTEFLGAERGLKRLALSTVGETLPRLQPVDIVGSDSWPVITSDMTLREALSTVSSAGAAGGRVADAGGRVVPVESLVNPPTARAEGGVTV